MHVLSILSIIVFGLSIIYKNHDIYRLEKGILRTSIILIGVSISWIAAASSQFYIASSKEAAWFWHRLANVGCLAIIPVSSIYILHIAGKGQFFSKFINRVVFFILPTILIIYNLFGTDTYNAIDVVQSRIGWGWTYVNSINSVWLWIYVFFVISYIGIPICIVNRNASKDNLYTTAKTAKIFTLLNTTIISLSLTTDLILPIFTDYFVPLGAIINIIPIIIIASLSKIYDLVHMENIIESEILLQTSIAAFLVVDNNGKIFFMNKKACEIFKKSNQELKGIDVTKLVFHDKDYYEAIEEFHNNKCFYDKIIHIDADNEKRSVITSVAEAYDKRKKHLGYIVSCQDITKILNIDELLEKQNNTDELTGLLNRHCFFKMSEKFIKDYNENNINFAAISINVDKFKIINHKFGHKFGDLVLIEVSKLLSGILNEDELIFRTDADEFIILISELNLIERINKLESEIDKFKNLTLTIENTILNVGLSYGSELYSEGRNFEDIIKNVYNKMNMNKRSKKYDSN